MSAKRPRVQPSSHSIPTSQAGTIEVHVFEPQALNAKDNKASRIVGTIVTVHPWSALGGGEHNTIGLARWISTSSSSSSCLEGSENSITRASWRVVTFALQSAPVWQGGPLWGICSAHSFEVQQIVDVVRWAAGRFGSSEDVEVSGRTTSAPLVLLGSSAGAPMAGSAMAQLLREGLCCTGEGAKPSSKAHLSAYVAIGYTFGTFASLGFGRHFSSVVGGSSSSWFPFGGCSNDKVRSLPKLFVMGEMDEFTTPQQLNCMVDKMRRVGDMAPNDEVTTKVDMYIVPGVGHFELESSRYDRLVARKILDWLEGIL